MIDLEAALAQIVDLAPEPPDVEHVTQRARYRRARRRGTALVATLVVIAAAVAGVVALQSPDHASKKVILAPTTESVRVTLLDGSQLEISGPASLGLTSLQPAFNAELEAPGDFSLLPLGHSFTVQRDAPDETGAVVGRYPTADGHELVVYTTPNGVDAVVHYVGWTLVSSWNHGQTYWGTFANALNARQTADGFLVIAPEPGWKLGPTDAPDVQLGGTAYGSDAAFSFFGPATYPAGCPTAAETSATTPQGAPVSHRNGTWWCDPTAKVRIGVGDPALVNDAVQGLRVAYSGVDEIVENVTTLARRCTSPTSRLTTSCSGASTSRPHTATSASASAPTTRHSPPRSTSARSADSRNSQPASQSRSTNDSVTPVRLALRCAYSPAVASPG